MSTLRAEMAFWNFGNWDSFFCVSALLLFLLTPANLFAQEISGVHFSTFATGSGPSLVDGTYRLLNGNKTFGQSNAIAFNFSPAESSGRMSLRCSFRILAGGEGAAFLFLNIGEFGNRGPAPFVKSWAEPNLAGTFAVGIDVHNPATEEPFGPLGNYQGLPEREVSLHWNGREIVKRVSAVEFRGNFVDSEISVQYVIGGAEISMLLAGEKVYDRYFIAGMTPYPARLAVGAGTGVDTTTEFDVRGIEFAATIPAKPQRSPTHFELFNHILTSNTSPAFQKDVTLPSLNWAYGRVILTLEIHDAGEAWDEWDRSGSFSIVTSEGMKYDIAPFVTSFRTPCFWQVDVTPFRPWLTGPVKFEITAGVDRENNRGYMMSASLDFYHGEPELEPFSVVPLWVGTAEYGPPNNHFSSFFTPQTVSIDRSTEAAQLFMTTTGHSPVGEFTPSRRTVIFIPGKGRIPRVEHRFENVLWKSDCYLNPNRPQFGTWKFARAGWAPGDVVHPWWIDLSPYIIPGQTAEFRYLPQPYDFSGFAEEKIPPRDQVRQASLQVRSYLILYRVPVALRPAPPLQIIGLEEGSNAWQGGVRKGDYLESYDGKRPTSIAELREAIRAAAAEGKTQIPIIISRGTDRLEMTLVPGPMGVTLLEI